MLLKVFEIFMARVNDGLEVNNGLNVPLHKRGVPKFATNWEFTAG